MRVRPTLDGIRCNILGLKQLASDLKLFGLVRSK